MNNEGYKLFDSHAHLQDERFDDLPAVIERARAAGVGRVLCCGTRERDWPRIAALAASWPNFIQPAFGLHPWYVAERSPRWEEALVAQLAAYPHAAVGEIGLDGALPSPDPAMESVCVAQLRLARRMGRPASLHGRKAWEPLADVLEAEGPFPAGVVLHAYSGPVHLIPRFAAAGAYFSFCGSITWSGNRRVRRALASVPAERLLMETDAPDIPAAGLPPAADGGRPRSEPAHLPRILRAIAEIRGWDEMQTARYIADNACRIFGAW